MENNKEIKRTKLNFPDKSYTREGINNINHTNINNNINITNYYPPPSQNYCNKQIFTFIDENGSLQNAISYPIKTTTHKTKKIKDSSHIQNIQDKKYHQCQSPYMKKILPFSKRQKSEEGNRIINVYKNSPSIKFLKSTRKKSVKNNFYDTYKKCETQNNTKNKINFRNNYNLDLSCDEINNKNQSNMIYHNNNFYNTSNTDINNKNLVNNLKYKSISKPSLAPSLTNNKSVISYDSNGSESLFNKFEKQTNIIEPIKQQFYKITPYEKNNCITYNYTSPTVVKKNKKNKNSNNKKFSEKKEISVEKKLSQFIILIQSTIRGFLLRIKLAQYLNLYERIKKGVSFIQYIIFQRMRFVLYIIIKNNLNNNKYSCLVPVKNFTFSIKNSKIRNSNISYESFKIKNNKNIFSVKNPENAEIQKELNKKKIDYAVAEKRIKELLLENKKIQNINKIIVRDNKQLALKLKNTQNNHHYTNLLKVQKNHFYYTNISDKNEIKLKLTNILRKIIMKKEIIIKKFLSKYFYKFCLKNKILYINEMNEKEKENNYKNLIIENKNFIINNNIITKDINNNYNENQIDKNKRNIKLKRIINKKGINIYIYRNIFEKWMMRALIFKNKEFVKEKKKKKKEKFKQRKQKKLYASAVDKNINNKKNEEEIDNSGDSEDFDIEPKNNNKCGSNQINNYFYDYDEK